MRDRSLKTKIIHMALFTTFMSLTICIISGLLFYNNSYRKRASEQMEENMSVVADRIENMYTDMTLCTNYLSLMLNNIENTEGIREYDKYNQIKSSLNSSVLIFDILDSIVYVDNSGKTYSTNYQLSKRGNEIIQSPYYSTISAAKNGQSILCDLESECMYRDSDIPVVTMGKRIIDITSGETLGFLFVNISIDELEKNSRTGTSNYYLYDTHGHGISQIYESDISQIIEDYSKEEIGTVKTVSGKNDRYMINSREIFKAHWHLVGVNNLHAFKVSKFQFLRMLFFVGLSVLILISILSFMLTGMLTKPLSKLNKGVSKIAEGNLDVKFDFETNDEIGRMGQVFNKMTSEISNLLEKVDQEAKQKRTYELALVQEQVKPHFLYNSLDIIIVLNEMGKTREATRVTRKLADYYRNSLSSSAEFVPLAVEFQILEDYLDLQLMRYEDKFTYNLELPSELEEKFIPKMTLQPLVENALYHGLKLKEDWGQIDVTARADENSLYLIVKDNGIGMTSNVLAKVEKLREKPAEHFGVYSVEHRLQLYYREKCTMNIESTYNVGTTVTITIPLEELEGAPNA